MANSPAVQSNLGSPTGRLAASVTEDLWFGDDDPERSILEASNSVASAIAKATGLKPFPVAASEVLRLLDSDNYKLADVQKVLETDPGLATQLLRVANSPLYSPAVPFDSIGAAVVRLGKRNVQETLLSAVTIRMFEDVNGLGSEFLEHCVGVAAIARVLARNWRFSNIDGLFLAGLLHDVGKLLSIQSKELSYIDFPPEALETADTAHVHERIMLGYDHAVLGGHVVRAWGIPEPVPSVIAWHHQPGRAFQHGGPIGLMVALLRIADKLEFEIRRSEYKFLGDDLAAALEKDESMHFADVKLEQVYTVFDIAVDERQQALTSMGLASSEASAGGRRGDRGAVGSGEVDVYTVRDADIIETRDIGQSLMPPDRGPT